MQKITPFLWFNGNAEEAVLFYTAIFEDAKIIRMIRYGKEGPAPEGTVMTAEFQLLGQTFIALNGGPQFQFTEAVSFVVHCQNQSEVDHYWNRLSEGGETSRCGWLKDRFGLSWQVVPTVLPQLLQGGNAAQAGRVMQALLQMDKIRIDALEEAYKNT